MSIYLKTSRLKEARQDIIQSKILNDTNPYVYKHSAMIYIEQSKFEKACEELNKAEELGYAEYSDGPDSNDVADLKLKHCTGLDSDSKK